MSRYTIQMEIFQIHDNKEIILDYDKGIGYGSILIAQKRMIKYQGSIYLRITISHIGRDYENKILITNDYHGSKGMSATIRIDDIYGFRKIFKPNYDEAREQAIEIMKPLLLRWMDTVLYKPDSSRYKAIEKEFYMSK